MTTQLRAGRSNLAEAELLPTLCPSSLTSVVTVNPSLQEVQLSLPSTATVAVVVTVQDQQTSPIPAMSVSVNPGDVLSFIFNERTMPGGIAVIASVASAVSTYIRWKQ